MTLKAVTRDKKPKDDRQMDAGNAYIIAQSSKLYRLSSLSPGNDHAAERLPQVHAKIHVPSFSINLIAAS